MHEWIMLLTTVTLWFGLKWHDQPLDRTGRTNARGGRRFIPNTSATDEPRRRTELNEPTSAKA